MTGGVTVASLLDVGVSVTDSEGTEVIVDDWVCVDVPVAVAGFDGETALLGVGESGTGLAAAFFTASYSRMVAAATESWQLLGAPAQYDTLGAMITESCTVTLIGATCSSLEARPSEPDKRLRCPMCCGHRLVSLLRASTALAIAAAPTLVNNVWSSFTDRSTIADMFAEGKSTVEETKPDSQHQTLARRAAATAALVSTFFAVIPPTLTANSKS